MMSALLLLVLLQGLLPAGESGDGLFTAIRQGNHTLAVRLVSQEGFRTVHPGKDYHAYRIEGDRYGLSVGTVIYRVETAIWK
ncbi:MAG: hypothetical protein SFV51_14725 [Bryobacteraceae bacterium]|nr:hypothetical protein [Bryobacteraceae bacterium]